MRPLALALFLVGCGGSPRSANDPAAVSGPARGTLGGRTLIYAGATAHLSADGKLSVYLMEHDTHCGNRLPPGTIRLETDAPYAPDARLPATGGIAGDPDPLGFLTTGWVQLGAIERRPGAVSHLRLAVATAPDAPEAKRGSFAGELPVKLCDLSGDAPPKLEMEASADDVHHPLRFGFVLVSAAGLYVSMSDVDSEADPKAPALSVGFTIPPGPGGQFYGGVPIAPPDAFIDSAHEAAHLRGAAITVTVEPIELVEYARLRGRVHVAYVADKRDEGPRRATADGTFDLSIGELSDETLQALALPATVASGPITGTLDGQAIVIGSAEVSVPPLATASMIGDGMGVIELRNSTGSVAQFDVDVRDTAVGHVQPTVVNAGMEVLSQAWVVLDRVTPTVRGHIYARMSPTIANYEHHAIDTLAGEFDATIARE